MPEDLKVSQIGSSPLPPPFRGLHSPGVRKHCQILFAWSFLTLSITGTSLLGTDVEHEGLAFLQPVGEIIFLFF